MIETAWKQFVDSFGASIFAVSIVLGILIGCVVLFMTFEPWLDNLWEKIKRFFGG
jgi:hypothetical protein